MYRNICLLSAIIFFNIFTMEEYINQQNVFGHTPLHYTSMLPSEIAKYSKDLSGAEDLLLAQEKDLKLLDQNKAKLAAQWIMCGASIDIKDKENMSPLEYAEKNKDKLPEIYKVMKAGKTIKDCKQKTPQPKNGQIYHLDELVAMSRMPAFISGEELLEWQKATLLLEGYLK